jgi:Protein of unknown function (DUF1501)
MKNVRKTPNQSPRLDVETRQKAPGSELQSSTRRHFFSQCSMGIGSIALASLMSDGRLGAEPASAGITNPLAPRVAHFPAKVKNVIFLFMAGGPSQLETFDYKPKLNELSGKPIPASFIEGKRFAFMGSSHRTDLLGFRPKFQQYGKNGTWVSDYLPHTAQVVDELTIVKTCSTDLFNHAPAKLFMNTGTGIFGRPSLGAWTTYGLGSECDNLPGFVVLQSGPRGPRGGAMHWSSGMLPTTYQGVPLRNQGDGPVELEAFSRYRRSGDRDSHQRL